MEELNEVLEKIIATLGTLAELARDQETRLQRIEVRLGLRVEEVAK